MFRAIISPIFRSTRLCVTACCINHPLCCRPVAWKRSSSTSGLPTGIIPVHYTTRCNTQASAPEDGRNYRPKNVELIGIINKLLLLHLVGCLYYLYQWCTIKKTSNHNFFINTYNYIILELTHQCEYTENLGKNPEMPNDTEVSSH
jgi:hypothetical protein